MTERLLTFLLTNGVWLAGLGVLLALMTRVVLMRGAMVHLLWMLIFVKVLFPPMISLEWAVMRNETNEIATPAVEPTIEPIITPVLVSMPTPDETQTETMPALSPEALPIYYEEALPMPGVKESGAMVPALSPRQIVAILWLLGTACVVMRSGWRIARFRRLLKKTAFAGEEWQQ